MESVDVLILGSGIAGLGAAFKATTLGRSAVILEKRRAPGGLLAGFVHQGYHFDNAVHLDFASEKIVRDMRDGIASHEHSADPYNFDDERWLRHPVQNNLFPLPADEKVELIKSFISRDVNLESENYGAWLKSKYGSAIALKYPYRYTRKYWQREPEELSTTWLGPRMDALSLDDILKGAMSEGEDGGYYLKSIRYPKSGGFGSYIRDLIEAADIRYSQTAVEIDTNNKIVQCSDGKSYKYKIVVSTIPLPILVKILRNCSPEIVDYSQSLKATSVDLISICFNKAMDLRLWFYIYDEDILASRAHSPSEKAAANAPAGRSSIQFEVYNPDRVSQYTVEELRENTIYALQKMKIAEVQDIESINIKHVEWANVVFDRGMDRCRDEILDYVEKIGVKSCGRFGAWEYYWSHQAFISGYEAI